ncbi:DUF3391 domain-containing protein [Alteromonas sp. ASW11-19]|uniref:DUF3391 domain-containing protein n=1 Tax=Alteromonas salexigens TaxID=2982530 RepID=A0ABT2VPR2_9ALTE|nr:HD-GYP domain-containing protein [Alteromonas salexigens]MCU7554852.1 DUF3391 domain-containing protein [Alteromonas salexigens]
MLKHVAIDELVPGMYVNKVVEQSGALKMRSKGVVKSPQTISALKDKGILVLEIDMAKSRIAGSIAEPQAVPPVPQPSAPQSQSEALSSANDLYMQAVSIQGELINALKKGGASDLSPISELSQSIIDSLFDNQDALSCLTMIKDADAYLLEHSINCGILMSLFAQHLEYDRDTIEQVCTGAMLMDVGMSAIPQELRYHTGELSNDDWKLVQTHVDVGVDMLEQCADISDLSLTIVAQHHERVDGSGYPAGLQQDTISTFAKMAAIVDTYDAMVSRRPHQDSLTPSVALKRLVKSPGLDQTMVKEFIRCVGVHPVGSLVRLKSGKLGIICKAGTSDMLSPVVMTFYSINSGSYNEIKRVDLSKSNDEIVSGVRPADFGINLPKFFREVFIHQVPDR